MAKKNTAVMLTGKEGQVAIVTKQDPKVILALLTDKANEKDGKIALTGVTEKSLAMTMVSITSETKDFIQKYGQFKMDSESLALHIFYARQQHKALKVGSSDMDFIRAYFDPKCPEKQEFANRDNVAYQCIVTYLFRLARKVVETERERRSRVVLAQSQTKAIKAGMTDLKENGVISQQAKNAIIASGVIIPEALKPVLGVLTVNSPIPTETVKPADLKAIEKSVEETTTAIAKSVDTPVKNAVVGQATKDPAAAALAKCKYEFIKIGVSAVAMNGILNQFVTELYEALGRSAKLGAAPMIKEADAKYADLITAKVA